MKDIRPLRSSGLFLALAMVLAFVAIRDTAIAQSGMGTPKLGERDPAASDTIYETNYRSNTIEIFSLSGADLGGFATPANPTGLVFDDAGNLYVSSDNPAGYAVYKFTPAGAISVFGHSGLSSPHALVFDKGGNLYVANPSGNTIEKFTPDGIGSVFADENDGLNNPLDLAFDTSGNLYVANGFGGPTDTGWVEKFTPSGVGSVFAETGFHTPFGLAFDRAGNLYVSNFDSSTIEKFSPPGRDLGVFARNGVNFPHDLIFDRAGNLYVANNGNSTIEKFAPDGTDLGAFASTGPGPQFLALFRPTHLRFETEELRVQEKSANYKILRDTSASGGAYSLLKAIGPGDFVSYSLSIAVPGTYNVKVGTQTRNNRGIFQLAIGGVTQGTPQDEYSAAINYDVRDLGRVTFTRAGKQPFRFTVTGRDASSVGYTLAFDYIDLDLVP